MKIELYSADGELQQTIGITRRDFGEGEGYDYSIKNYKTGVEGFVEVMFKDLDWFEERAEPVFGSLLSVVSPDTDTIAEITRFYPHKEPVRKRIPRSVTQKGIGSCALDTILNDLKSQGFVNFYAHNPELRVYGMLLRRDFIELPTEDLDDHLFKQVS